MGKKYIELDGKKVYIKDEDVPATPETPVEEPIATPAVEEPVVPTADEAAAEEKQVASIASKIASMVTEKVAEVKKVRAEDSARQKALGGDDVRVNDPKVKIFTLKSGKDVFMTKHQMVDTADWFKAFINKDMSLQRKLVEDMERKWEPLNETTAGEGGNLVPTLLYNVIVPLLEDAAVIRPNATVIDMTGMKTNQLNISGIATKPIVQWGAEQSQKATSSMTFNQISLTPYRLAAIVQVTTELRDDSPFSIVQIVGQALAEAVAKAEDQAFMNGSGSGRPTGIDNYTLTGFDAADVVNFSKLNRLYWMLPQAYRANACWIMNGRAVSECSGLLDTNNRPIFGEYSLQSGIPTFKGRPVYEQNDTKSDSIFFGDLRAYYIGLKRNMTIDIADQATVAGYSLWERNMIAIRVEESAS